MKKNDKIYITKLYVDTELGNSRLEFNIKGSDINYIILNTIRRVIFSNIPIYAFTNFKFIKNTSIFHNNYLKLRISNIPIWGIINDNTILNKPKFELENNDLENLKTINDNNSSNITVQNLDFVDNDDDLEMNNDIIDTVNHSSLDQLTVYVNYKNKSNTIVNVTTDNANFYYNKKQIANPYNNSVQLLKLQPHQEIIFTAITSLGVEENNAIFSAVSIVTYKEISENEFIFIIESRGQISEVRIIHVAILYILELLDEYYKIVKEFAKNISENPEHKNFIIKLENVDSTIGNLISKGYQMHDDVDFAGYNIEHPLDTKLNIHYRLKKNNIVNVTMDVITYFKNVFKSIDSNLKSLKLTETV